MATVSLPQEKSYIYIIALIWIVIIIFVLFSVLTIFRNKNIYFNTPHTKSKAQAQLLGENTSSVLYSVDLTLLSILLRIKLQAIQDKPVPETMVESIKTQSMFLPQIRNIILFNAEKKIIYSLRAYEVFELTSFEEHKDAWLDFYITTAMTNRNKKLIVLSRRVEDMNGEFAGVLAATIDPVFFYNRYANYLNIDVDAVALSDARRNVLTSWYNNSDMQSLYTDNDSSHFLSGRPGAALEGGGLKTHEDIESIISIYQLPDFPFQLTVLHNKDRVLQEWYQKTRQDIAIITATVLIGIITMVLASAQRKKRRKAERLLLDYQNHLEDMIEKRTLNLKRANNDLLLEIDVRSRTEVRLKESEHRYRQIYSSISDCLFIADVKGFISDANPAACNTYGYSREDLTGRHLTELIHKDYHSNFEQFVADLSSKGSYYGETIDIRKDGTFLNTEVKGTLFILKGERHLLAIIRDVTERKQSELQREKLISELQKALDEIKTLKGIVPICSTCKKIRDDKGFWNSLESYIQKHSDASFSHGICPECSDKLYGDQDWYIQMKKEKEGKSISR